MIVKPAMFFPISYIALFVLYYGTHDTESCWESYFLWIHTIGYKLGSINVTQYVNPFQGFEYIYLEKS